MRRITCLLTVALLVAAGAAAHDQVPGSEQVAPVLLKGGDLYTVSQGVLDKTDLLFEDGRITRIGRDLTAPEGARVIDVTGQCVYPGLIAANTAIGLIEIGAVLATDDRSEVGAITPEVQAHIAYNPDSEIIPSTRSDGVTTVEIVPGGRLIRGRSSLINLDGWTVEDAAEKLDVALHVSWPRSRVVDAWWMEKTPEEQKKEMAEDRRWIYETFDKARAYYLAQKANPAIERDLRWEAMIPVFDRSMPVFIRAFDYPQIEEAVGFAQHYGFRLVIVGGTDAWMLTDLLKAHDVPVIVRNIQALPPRADDDPTLVYSLPARLAEAEVRFCLSASGGGPTATGVRRLPFVAGHAVAYGLPEETALRAITLSVAEILGVADDLGSLDVGKKATLVVSRGDIMDYLGHDITLMFIEGREVDLDNKHKELQRKYRQKHLQPAN